MPHFSGPYLLGWFCGPGEEAITEEDGSYALPENLSLCFLGGASWDIVIEVWELVGDEYWVGHSGGPSLPKCTPNPQFIQLDLCIARYGPEERRTPDWIDAMIPPCQY
jgi:hypothetical protein